MAFQIYWLYDTDYEKNNKRFVWSLNSYLIISIRAREFKTYSVVVDHVWDIKT
jgi:hypothetical protein